MIVNTKFYEGFEGSPQITFCLTKNNFIEKKISIWDGYFNDIMNKIQPQNGGWTGLAYYYHLHIGWYEEDEWLIPDILEAYNQLSNINTDEFKYEEEKEILILITDLMKKGMEHGEKMYIVYD